ncbi:hypothetical protein GCM10010412_017680 [Nonomuraea recticatena]|uniref:Uncharacterized protein n=1 Tax=Nonomuraea recticatena TaxID=46178 RepID=A0ABN3RG22_9ACTN
MGGTAWWAGDRWTEVARSASRQFGVPVVDQDGPSGGRPGSDAPTAGDIPWSRPEPTQSLLGGQAPHESGAESVTLLRTRLDEPRVILRRRTRLRGEVVDRAHPVVCHHQLLPHEIDVRPFMMVMAAAGQPSEEAGQAVQIMRPVAYEPAARKTVCSPLSKYGETPVS